MKRIIPLFFGAFLGVGVVVGLLYLLLDHTSLVSNLAPAPQTALEASVPEPDAAAVTDSLPQVVMTVNGVAITRDMVEAEIKISRLNIVEPLPPLSGEDLTRAQEEALNQLTTRQLILQAATRQGFRLDDEFVQQRVDLLFGTYGEAALDEALDRAGASREDVTWWVRDIFTVEEFTTQVVMAGAAPEARQQVYNDWLNEQRAAAEIIDYTQTGAATLQASVGQAAPDFSLPTPDNQQIALADYRGRVVLVNFWATWCPSCVVEMPAYEQVYQKYGGGQADFVILGVNLQDEAGYAQEYANGLGVTFPILLDRDGQVTTRHYQASGMPASFIIDRQGNIYYRHLGPMSGELLEEKLGELGL